MTMLARGPDIGAHRSLWNVTRARISVVVVTYDSEAPLATTLPALAAELRAGDELIVVDNASRDGTLALVRALAPAARVLAGDVNRGFPWACNEGARVAGGDVLVFLNPDAAPCPGWGAAIRRPAEDGRGWAAWQALVTAEDGRVINTSGNVVHFTGVAWAGQAGRPLQGADVSPREVGYLSGACLAVRREAFEAVAGFSPEFFLYHEDLDLSLRLRLAGGRLGLEPDARVEHDYEFHKGSHKWRYMERNRGATLVRCWPGPVLVVAAPALLVAEAAIWAAAFAGGWQREKARATVELWRALPRLRRERKVIQRGRRIGGAQFAAWLHPELSSPYLGRASRSRLVDGALRLYWALALRALGPVRPGR
jgi:GT2 family glycosyltransferase